MDPQVDTAVPPADEPFLGTLDIILLIALAAGGLYYLFTRQTKKAEPEKRSYSIQ